MGNKKIVLIGFHNEKALGVRYLANALTQSGYEPHVVFFKRFNSEVPESATEQEMTLLQELIAKIAPLFIGMSVMSSLYTETTDRVSDMIRAKFPHTPLVWGGVCATLNPERSLRSCDIVLRGEGEKSITLLAQALEAGEDWRSIHGAAYLDENGAMVQNDVGEIQADIDEYGYPIIGGPNTTSYAQDAAPGASGTKELTWQDINANDSRDFYDPSVIDPSVGAQTDKNAQAARSTLEATHDADLPERPHI